MGIQDIVGDLAGGAQETMEDITSTALPYEPTSSYDFGQDVYRGTEPQETHSEGRYPFTYPYPPFGYQQTAGPTTLPAAHYQIAGTPNLMIPSAAAMPNPSYWSDRGGIMNPRTPWQNAPYEFQFGTYYYYQPSYQQRGYQVQGTNISYPFINAPYGPAPCPYGEYRAGDGRCYPLQAPPPEQCQTGYYRASDGRCYPVRR